MKICWECKHCLSFGDNWHSNHCTVIERPKGVDPITGKECYLTNNDLGNSVETGDKYPNCREHNSKGDCPFYERGEMRRGR